MNRSTCAHDALANWQPYLERYQRGEWRDRVFLDMILADAAAMGPDPTILDIGCGRGFDGDVSLQEVLARAAGRYIGIEPDPDIPLGPYFTEIYRSRLEDAPLPADSVHIACSVMVLEHLPDPGPFWDKVWDVLADGGVFWGLTVDGRHPFCWTSLWAERLGYCDGSGGSSPSGLDSGVDRQTAR